MKKYLKLTDVQRKDLVKQATELQLKGLTSVQIREKLSQGVRGATDYLLKSIVAEARKEINKEHLLESDSIKALHINRYDQMINDHLSVQELNPAEIVEGNGEIEVDSSGNLAERKGITFQAWKRSRDRKIRAYDNALNTLIQKENLLHLVNMDRDVEINEEIDINIIEKKAAYDISRLTFEEQIEMLELIGKARKPHFEPMGVIESEIMEEIPETVDVDAEVLPANVEQVNQIPSEIIPLLDFAVPFDPIAKLKVNMAKLAAKKFKEAGFNLTDDENELID